MQEKKSAAEWDAEGYEKLAATNASPGDKFFLALGEGKIVTTYENPDGTGRTRTSIMGKGLQIEIVEKHEMKPNIAKIKVDPDHPTQNTMGWTDLSTVKGHWYKSKRTGQAMSKERAEELLDLDGTKKTLPMRMAGIREAMLDAMLLIFTRKEKPDEQSKNKRTNDTVS